MILQHELIFYLLLEFYPCYRLYLYYGVYASLRCGPSPNSILAIRRWLEFRPGGWPDIESRTCRYGDSRYIHTQCGHVHILVYIIHRNLCIWLHCVCMYFVANGRCRNIILIFGASPKVHIYLGPCWSYSFICFMMLLVLEFIHRLSDLYHLHIWPLLRM